MKPTKGTHRFLKAVRWALIVALYWTLALLGLRYHFSGVWNLFRFWAWVSFICTVYLMLGYSKIGEGKLIDPPSISPKIRWITDLFGIAMLAYFGTFFYAGLCTVQAIMQSVYLERCEEVRIEKEADYEAARDDYRNSYNV